MAVSNKNKNDSARNDWMTPENIWMPILNLINPLFSSFDVDVCCTETNVFAQRYYTEEVNGLLQEWRGHCWMNPPYAEKLKPFVKKAYEESQKGAEVWSILPARTENGYYQDLIFNNPDSFFVLLRGGIGMINPDTKEQTPASNKYIIAYFGKRAEFWYKKWVKEKPLKGKAVLGGEDLKKQPYKCNPTCFNYKVKQDLEKRAVK